MLNAYQSDIIWTEQLHPWNNEVHVYRCDINELDIATDHALLSQQELAKARAFRHRQDAMLFTTGRVIAKKLLAFYTSADAFSIMLNSGKNGKPVATIKGREIVPAFNISHSGNMVLIACGSQPVGVDVEIAKAMELDNLADAVFCEEELQQFNTSSNPVGTFYHFWTRKEALLKAVGVGLTDDLKLIDTSARVDDVFAKQFTDAKLNLLSFTIEDAGQYFASLCYPKGLITRFIKLTNEAWNRL